jgi:hypothetical protein
MLIRALLAVAGALLLVGCAGGGGPAAPQLSDNDPANPAAAESPLPSRSQTLALNEDEPLPSPATNSAELMPEMGKPGHDMAGMQHGSDMARMQHAGHDMAGMKHMPPATRPGENAAISAARWTPTTLPATGPTTAATIYTCPMHPDVISSQPGTCPKCGMKLVPKRPMGEQSGHGGHGGRP